MSSRASVVQKIASAALACAFLPAAVSTIAVPSSIERLDLRVGESARLDSPAVTIVFEKVESDSRCPTGAKCVWAGDAVVRLGVGQAGGARTILRLHTNPDFDQEARHAGYVVRLIELHPYPTIERTIDEKTYRARLTVKSAEP